MNNTNKTRDKKGRFTKNPSGPEFPFRIAVSAEEKALIQKKRAKKGGDNSND